MKKIYLILCLGSLLFINTRCSKSSSVSPAPKVSPVMQITISPEVAKNTSSFAFNFFNALQQTQPDTGNIFVSPLSLHIDLGMLLNGANADTYTQLQNALDLNGLSLSDINTAYQTLLKALPNADAQVQLALANSMWYKNVFPIEQDYTDTLKTYFNTVPYPSLFGSGAIDSINNWASQNTNGKINEIIKSISPGEVMYLINALYFKGEWASQFDKSKTQPQTFTLENGSTKQVQMMSQTNDYTYATAGTYALVKLPYGNGQFSMTILLPNSGNKIEDVMNNFTADDWNTFQQDTFKTSVNVQLPRFSIPLYDVDLISTLQAMGATDVFSDRLANLSKINAAAIGGWLYVNILQQFTYLNVDEEGSEAAAVTVTGMTNTSVPPPPPSFICNHPFGIIISENTSNTILFMGRIMNPQSN